MGLEMVLAKGLCGTGVRFVASYLGTSFMYRAITW